MNDILEIKKIFISHINEEKDFAITLKEWLLECFNVMVDVFVSSDGNSISLGDDWPQKIKEKLEKSHIFIVLISHNSKSREWIYFESGAGYVRGIPVIPICIGGLKKEELPVPLNFLQAIELPNLNNQYNLIDRIARLGNFKSPPETVKKGLKLPNTKIVEEQSLKPKSNKKSINLIEDFKINQIRIKVINYFTENETILLKENTLTELEFKLGQKGKQKRKYILNFMEELVIIKFVEKIQREKSTNWKVTKLGFEKMSEIKKLTLYDQI